MENSCPPPPRHKPRIRAALQEVLRRAFSGPAGLIMAPENEPTERLRHGFHCHDGWEMFVTLTGAMNFESAGRQPLKVNSGHVLLVPPRCLHIAGELKQPAQLRLFVLILSDGNTRYGTLRAGEANGGERWDLSEAELGSWARLLGASPAELMNRVVEGLRGGPFCREHAYSLLRLLISALGEAAFGSAAGRAKPNERKVNQALAMLHSEYYKPKLNLGQIASAVRVSPPRLAFLFKKTTGRTLHQTLISIRLKRAQELLREGALSVKETAALTGWSNQLYFSSAFRKQNGYPPSRARPGGTS